MSFQGDVAGIGLGELLQGLARGGRDGVLTLDGDDRCAMLGLHKGQLYVLPAPDEDESVWRRRCEHAWIERQEPGLETSRRLAIARVGRLETVYRMLAAPNLHFRFEQGPLPLPSYNVAGTASKAAPVSLDDVAPHAPQPGSPWGAGWTVEHLLLEYARIADESASGPASRLTAHDIPRALDPHSTQGHERVFLQECDGSSTLQEIADRLEITLSECRSTVGELMAAGRIRVAEPRELLAACQKELEMGRLGRASMRLSGWLDLSPAGGPLMGDAELLLGEWHCGRLEPLLKHLKPRVARILMRKLDFVQRNREASLKRWTALVQAHHADPIVVLHEIALRLTASAEPETRTFHDLLRMARDFHESGHDGRTRALLRLAANHLPARPQTRVELGKHMLDSGLVDDGVRWLLDTARELADADKGERALVPIRIVLRRIPDHPEANELLIETRLLVKQRRRRRWSMISALSLGVILSLCAFVRTHHRREIEYQLSQVQGHMDDPALALELLNDYFGKEASAEIVELRESLLALKSEAERRVLEDWNKKYDTAEEECSMGDALLGVRLALELDDAPEVDGTNSERQDLFGILARRLNRLFEQLDLPPSAQEEELANEKRFLDMLEEMVRLIPEDVVRAEESSFRFRLVEMRDLVVKRREERAVKASELKARSLEREQDLLLASARSHDRAGDLERAIAAYERLAETDPTLSELPEFRRELETVRAHYNGVKRAEELSAQGEHEAAEAALEGVCRRAVEHLMPWQVESHPSGAHVTLPDGNVQTTPFTMRSAFGERVELSFQFPGCEPRVFVTTKPRDLLLHLHSFPERVWAEGTDVEAAPVAVGEDHVVADRRGRLVRLDPQSRTRWECRLDTLGGIARTPVFLPEAPSKLLVLSEDGVAWLVDATSGTIEGSREIGSPPRRGPFLTRAGVTVSFADERIGVWTNGLEPTFYRAEGSMRTMLNELERGPSDRNATLSLLNRGVNSELSLKSPWTTWKVEVQEEQYLITSTDGKAFSALREGTWNFVAWESPKGLLPQGRLWVSDAKGLRSYLPQDSR